MRLCGVLLVAAVRVSAWIIVGPSLFYERKVVIAESKRSFFGGVRRLLFRGSSKKKEIDDEKAQLSGQDLKTGQEIGIVKLEEDFRHVTRAEMSRSVLDARDPSDEELWDFALREVRAAEEFAKEAMPEPVVRRRINTANSQDPVQDVVVVDKALQRSWPDLEAFTKMLKNEAVFRLRILGPAFAEPLKEETRWRREIYSAFLDLTDGVGLIPLTNETELFQPDPGLVSFNDKVHDVYDDLLRRRDDIRRARAQFDDWERRAATKSLLQEKNSPLSVDNDTGLDDQQSSSPTIPLSSPNLASTSTTRNIRSPKPLLSLRRIIGGASASKLPPPEESR